MDSGMMVLLLTAALIVGVAVGWFFFRKRNVSSENSGIQQEESPKDIYEISKIQLIEAEKNVLKNELAKLQKEKEEMLSKYSNLEEANKSIRQKLAEADK